MIRLDRSSDFGPGAARFCASRLQPLFNAATSGRGSCELASTLYNSPEYQLVQTAFHEAGHAIAARGYGLWAEIHVEGPRNGWCNLEVAPCLPQRRCIALAGAVAELLATYGLWQSEKDLCRSAPFFVSKSDREYAGWSFESPDVLASARQVRQLWGAICREACDGINQHVAARSLQ